MNRLTEKTLDWCAGTALEMLPEATARAAAARAAGQSATDFVSALIGWSLANGSLVGAKLGAASPAAAAQIAEAVMADLPGTAEADRLPELIAQMVDDALREAP